nr:EthD domain-containing protein [uncultured Holophaga sp.]
MPIKLMAASRRRPGLTRAEYFRYIEQYHGTVARLEPFRIAKYIQNHVIDGAFGLLSDRKHQCKTQDREAVVDLHFNCFPDLVASLDTGGDKPSRAAMDGQYFADEPTNILVMAEEFEMPVTNPMPTFNPGLGEPGYGAVRVLHYVMRRPEVFPQDFHRLWEQAHAEAYAKSPYAQEMFRKVVANRRCRVNDNDGPARKHFGMIDPPIYDLVTAITLDSMEQAGAFRQYLEALQASTLGFANWSESFFLYTRPVRIIDNTPLNV